MAHPSLPPIDADLPNLLRRLASQAAGDFVDGHTLARLGSDRLCAPITLLGALCLGGTGLALKLAAIGDPAAEPEGHLGALLDAFEALTMRPPDAPADHEIRIGQALVDGFGLDADPRALLDLLRIRILVDHGPLTELPDAVMAAMRHADWALALDGLARVRAEAEGNTPRQTYGLGAICLHRLGRFEEADAWTQEGLGDQGRLLHTLREHSEDELFARWKPFDRPVVTILCTTYNHERYIESALRGFLGQDCSHPFEILIHDDASTDGTQAVVRRWAARYPRIIKPVLQVENRMSQGILPFEILLGRAQGDFVATCEGDDYWIRPDKLQRQVDCLLAHPELSCSAHNYYHYDERSLAVRPWSRIGHDFYVTPRQMMAAQILLWMPTLVFRRTFDALPPERALAAFGDQFLTSFLGTLGRCAYLETFVAAVRRENEFSSWSPLPEAEKERRRVATWTAMRRMHARLGHVQAVSDIDKKIEASPLDAAAKAFLRDRQTPSPSRDAVAAHQAA